MFRQIKKINNKEYNYLEHSFRIGKKIRKISFYISRTTSHRSWLAIDWWKEEF